MVRRAGLFRTRHFRATPCAAHRLAASAPLGPYPHHSRTTSTLARQAATAAAAALFLLATPQSQAFQITLDAAKLGDSTDAYVFVQRCRIRIAIVDGPHAVKSVAGAGLGIAGAGPNDGEIDGGEQIELRFPGGPVRGVSYRVSSASNVDGGEPGETFVRAWDDVQELGIEPVSGVGAIDVSALFGGAPIERMRVISAPDGVRISRISYQAPPISIELFLDRLSGGSESSAEFTQCGITFRGSPRFANLNSGGFGVVGGNDGTYIDAGEELEVDFGEPVEGARYYITSVEVVGPGTHGGHFVEAFDAQGASLGVKAASGGADGGWVDLTSPSFYGDVAISRFVLIATGDYIQLERVGMVPEPDGAGAAALLALVVLCARRRHARP